MRRPDSLLITVIAFLCAVAIRICAAGSSNGNKLLTCVKCLGNDTECRNVCTGYYCYKYEIKGQPPGPVKRGCLNATDPLSTVNECTFRTTTFGLLSVTENFCICSTDRCNSTSVHIFSAVHSLFLLVFSLLFL